MSKERIADKIAKIIAIAEDTTHPEEAASFMAKAQLLMQEHGLSLLEIGKLDSDDPVGELTGDYLKHNASSNWRGLVGSQLAGYYGCRIVMSGARGTGVKFWTVFGRESARTTFNLMWPYVARQIMQLGNEAAKRGEFTSAKKAHSYIGNALALRIAEMVREQEKPESETGKGLRALVPVDMLEQLMNKRFPNATKGKRRNVRTNAAAEREAGRVNLNYQTTAAPKSRQIA